MKINLAQRFGLCVRELRLTTGMSQVVFGEKCGFYQTYLSRIENGQANPSLNAIEVIANAFGMTFSSCLSALSSNGPDKPLD